MADESPGPWEYGSDLHWLWGWGERLRAFLSDDLPPSHLDWMMFLPDDLARDAMMRLSVKYSHVIKQVDDYLVFTQTCFARFLEDDNESSRATFTGAMLDLAQRIDIAVDTIVRSEAGTVPSPSGRSRPARRRRKPGPKPVHSSEKDQALARDWEIARGRGTYKADFAREKGYSLREFERLLARVRMRKRRAN